MIGYVTLGTNDFEAAKAFYGALLGEFGARTFYGSDRIQFYSAGQGQPMVALCKPYDGEAHHPGNGQMLALPSGSPEGVDKLYAKAIELGATCDGEPGQRLPVFYGAYVRDLDGNKICFFHMSGG